MRQSWQDYEGAAEQGPLAFVLKIIFGVVILAVVLGGIGYVLGFFGEGGKVVQDEFGPQAALKKYMWFKEAAARLDEKRATIQVYEDRMRRMARDNGTKRSQWTREDREQYNLWDSELAGLKASYNQLAAEYNAKMAEMNWRFANVGTLPSGATEALPREFRPYITQ